jgi:3-oxoacyl-[acyl-carrier protein] reductase
MQDKVALVTGSARGIGQAIAQRFAERGAQVVLNYSKNDAQAQQALSAITDAGGKAIAVKADVSQLEGIDTLFRTVRDRFGKLDIVVANAGVELIGQAMIDVTEADFDRLIRINTKGTFFTLQRAARDVADNGRIIFVGTSNTKFPLPGVGLYGGSKIPGQFWVEILSKEVGRRGITVNTLLPTATEGAGVFSGGAQVPQEILGFIQAFRPIQRMGTTADAANVAEFLASDLASFVSGQHLLVSGGAPA